MFRWLRNLFRHKPDGCTCVLLDLTGLHGLDRSRSENCPHHGSALFVMQRNWKIEEEE
jgi:hypothetical protein